MKVMVLLYQCTIVKASICSAKRPHRYNTVCHNLVQAYLIRFKMLRKKCIGVFL